MSTQLKTILILGTHGQKNLGDDLLLETFVRALDTHTQAPVHFIINSYDPAEIESKYQDKFSVESFHTTRDILRLPYLLMKSDVVLFAGGSILKELYSTTSRGRSSSLLMILGVITLARCLWTPVLLSHIGVSNLKHRFPRFVAGMILRFSTQITFRDQESAALATSIYPLVTTKSEVVPDVVFALPQLLPASTIYDAKSKKMARIGLNLNAAIKDPARWPKFVDELEQVLLQLKKHTHFQLVCIPFQCEFEEYNDKVVLHDFAQRMQRAEISVIETAPASFTDISQVLHSLDIFIVERFHGVILSMLSNVSFLALSYDQKVSSLVDQFDAAEVLVDIYEPLNTEVVAGTLEELLENKSVLVDQEAVSAVANDVIASLKKTALYVDAL